jgi:hypothetical protein
MTNSKMIKSVEALEGAGIVEEISYNDEPMYKFKG